jgi:lysophospholipase L1-like esterase
MTNGKNASASGTIFKDCERWCVTGDSLTHSGFYHEYIHLYYATRFPDNRLEPFNCGINGNKASSILTRLEGDVLIHKPTLISILIAMNDVGQAFPADKTDDFRKEQRSKDVAAYRDNMRTLLTRLQKTGIRTLLITPTIYDETLVDPKACDVNPGHQGALVQCAAVVRELGSEFGVPVIDWNQALANWNTRLQKDDPSATIVSPDRVHPTEMGHFVMAYEFLKAQGAPGDVSRIAIDASTGQPGDLIGCSIGNIKKGPGSIAFVCREKSLPYAVSPSCRAALDFLPFMEELNREMLQVGNLEPGSYRVRIDGIPIQTYSAEQLQRGVNLAAETSTPQYRQAQAVEELVARRAHIYRTHLRCIAEMEWGFLENVDRAGKSPGELKKILDEKIEKEKGMPWYDFCKGQAILYMESKPHEETYQGEIAVLLDQINLINKPAPHHFEVSRVP